MVGSGPKGIRRGDLIADTAFATPLEVAAAAAILKDAARDG